ncbi:MAG: DNA polymerase III subunit delta [candidate division Zixibacteria bacterium]|nr:DNA polymerase III subunit delta [candidate division Zixibacteria bacterium]
MGFSEDRATGKFGPFYLLTAENPYVLWDAVESWKNVSRTSAGASRRTFTAPHIDFERLSDLGTTLPMFETLQLVHVANVDRVPSARQTEFVEILRRFGATNRVLLTAEAIDRRTTFFKALSALGLNEAFPRIYPENLPGWVMRIAGEFDWALSPDAVDLLVGVHGSDLFEVRQTIERATLFIGARRRIEKSDVERVIAGQGEHDVFQLVEALAREDTVQALAIVRSLQAVAIPASFWLRSLTTSCIRLIRLCGFKDKPDTEIGRELGMHPWLVGKLRPQAMALGVNGLTQAIAAIFEADWAIKTSTMTDRLAAELLVWRLASRRRRIAPNWFDLGFPTTRE